MGKGRTNARRIKLDWQLLNEILSHPSEVVLVTDVQDTDGLMDGVFTIRTTFKLVEQLYNEIIDGEYDKEMFLMATPKAGTLLLGVSDL